MTRKHSIIKAAESLGVELHQHGREYLGRCPIHDDRTPSFTANPEKNLFYCFGCGAGGDSYDLVRKARGLTFPEARRFLGVNENVRNCEHTDRQARLVRAFRRWCQDELSRVAIDLATYRWIIAGIRTEFDLELVANAGFFDELPVLEHKRDVLFSGTDEEKLNLYQWEGEGE